MCQLINTCPIKDGVTEEKKSTAKYSFSLGCWTQMECLGWCVLSAVQREDAGVKWREPGSNHGGRAQHRV